ncbi:MAG: 16S rRNA (guanine(527)-N(7))-methyltransferase RsmG [Treponema sp.]|nr:16S rRNA (guanine(527)-N(7))-methyltransferase RsmG [Treponema sp.]
METQSNTNNVLHEGLVALGFSGSGSADAFSGIPVRPLSELEPLFERYIALLQEYNAKFDLINTDEHDDIAVRHILDSLAAAKDVASITASGKKAAGAETFLAADIGSGAGLPGIPLAAAFFEQPFVLVERMSKRCAFLETCARELGLQNVTVEENQAERLEQNRFNLVVFRAFRPLEKKMMHVLRRILKPAGVLAAYKARQDKIAEEMQALGKNMPNYTVRPLTVPFLSDHERNLVVIEK